MFTTQFESTTRRKLKSLNSAKTAIKMFFLYAPNSINKPPPPTDQDFANGNVIGI
jgi:hypothetical protein